MDEVFVVPDSNVFFHYTWFEKYPWDAHEELRNKKITIVFVRPVIEELDRNKDENVRGNVRDRCKKLLGWIETNLSSRSGTSMELDSGIRVQLDMQSLLDMGASRADDRIVAHATHLSGSCIICSKDYTVRLLARESKLQAIEPLPSERITDEEETEVARIRKEYEQQQSRLPKLSISIPGGQFLYSPMPLPFDAGAFDEERFDAFTKGFFKTRQFSNMFSMNEYDEGEVQVFAGRIETCIGESVLLATCLCQAPLIEISVGNEGFAFASNIEISVELPEDYMIISLSNITWPSKPEEPTTSLYKAVASSIYTSRLGRNKDKTSDWAVEGRTGLLTIGKMSHGSKVNLPSFFAVTKAEPKKKFGIKVKAVCHEIAKHLEVTIPIIQTVPANSDQERCLHISDLLHRHLETRVEKIDRIENEESSG